MSTLFRGGGGGGVGVWGGGGAAFEVPLTKKLNNFKAVQAGTTNLSDFSKNLSREVYVNTDVTTETEFWPPRFFL